MSEEYAKSNKKYDKNKVVEVNMVTLDTFLESENCPSEFDFLSIDIEGYEVPALKNYSIDKWSPKMVAIECNKRDPKLGNLPVDGTTRYQWINNFFTSRGYKEIYESDVNSVFIKEN